MYSISLSKLQLFSGLSLILIGVLGRFFMLKFVGIPNFEIITALTLVSAVFLGGVWTIVVPLSIIAVTDVFIGNNPVLLFTWSAFAIIGIFGWLYKKYRNPSISPFFKGGLRGILDITGLGIFSSIFFFLYTNFGWWLISGMYPHTLEGLIQCYIMGIPFFRNNLIGNLIFVPMFSSVALGMVWLNKKLPQVPFSEKILKRFSKNY